MATTAGGVREKREKDEKKEKEGGRRKKGTKKKEAKDRGTNGVKC